MTYRNFGPEMLNAGRTRRQMIPGQQEKQSYMPAQAPKGSAVNDLTHELEAIANELVRLKAGQSQAARVAQFQSLAASRDAQQLQNTSAQNFGSQNLGGQNFDTDQLTALVKSLKNDVRTQMRDDLDAQYVRLRDELDGLNSAIAGTSLYGSFKGEITELLSGLETLANGNRSIQNSQDKLSQYLHRELGELQTSLNGLAKSENLAKLDDRWNSLENRWTKLENRLEGGLNTDLASHLSDISARLAALHNHMDRGGLEAVEDRLLVLAKSVDALAQNRHSASAIPADFGQIDKRFDELSRAVAAIGNERTAPAVDNQALEQIESAIGLLSRKLELFGNMSGKSPAIDAIEAQLNQLNERFSELPDYFNHAPVMERIDRLAEKVSALPTPTLSPASIDALTQQLNSLATEVRGNGSAKSQPDGMFDRLDDRLGSIETRLAGLSLGEAASNENQAVIDALETRFAELSQHLEFMQQPAAGTTNHQFESLEQKIGDIARQLKQTSATPSSAAPFERLENQIADLSSYLIRQSPNDNDGLAARFDSLESLLSQNQLAVLDAARQTAEDAALRFKSPMQTNGQSTDQTTGADTDNAHIIGVIAGELATLEQLTRNSNDRSTTAFEGIHGALLKISERLGALESNPAPLTPNFDHATSSLSAGPAVQAEALKMPKANAAFVDDAFFAPGLESSESDLSDLNLGNEPGVRKARSPAIMAQEAASAAVQNINPQTAAAEAARNSLPGGELDDVPLTPGAAVPDLNSILKRVRDQKKATQSQNAKEVDRKDHFLSITRAAQAAAAEVQPAQQSANSSGKFGNVKDLYAKFRRPILIVAAAAVVVIAALQLSNALFSNDSEQAPEAAVQSLEEPKELAGSAAVLPNTLETAAPLESSIEPALKDVETIAPQAVTETAKDAPRIVGEAAETPKVTEGASVAPDLMKPDAAAPAVADPVVSQPEQQSAAAETNTMAVAPTIPQGFGPKALVEAAGTKDVKAQFEMGRRLAENQNNPALLKNAFEWFNAAAAQGFAPAQYRVGNMYEKGLGVERSAADAKLWYQMAAEAGNASAMHNLAVLFASGADGTVDSASALRWFQKAADLGVGDSQFNLGVMMGKGQGVEQDLEESYKWLALLAKSGDKEAATKRDEVAQSLRPEQLASAKAKVELWKPQAAIATANDLSIPDGWKISGATTASVDVKKAIKNVQLILTKLGYQVGKPDGVMGENTRQAIRAFQKKEKLAVSGEIDEPLVKALLAKNKA